VWHGLKGELVLFIMRWPESVPQANQTVRFID
jgi:hypothetical protein